MKSDIFLRIINAFSRRLGLLCAVLILLMTFVSAANAILRYIGKFLGTNLTSNALVEAQWQLFAASFLLGSAYVLSCDKHVRVDVWYGRQGNRGKAWINIVGTLLFLIPFCIFGIWSSWDYVLNSWSRLEVSNSSGGLPLYPIKTLIPVSFFLLLLQGIALLLSSLFSKEESWILNTLVLWCFLWHLAAFFWGGLHDFLALASIWLLMDFKWPQIVCK